MRIFVAGGSGTIGVPLVRALVGAGHQVTAMTRSRERSRELVALGADVAVADALDAAAVARAVAGARPTHVMHQLTALPKAGVRRASDLEATNRLRIDGTRHLLDAAIQAGARRLIVGSFAMLSDRDDDGARAVASAPPNDAAAAVRSMESQVLDASARGAIEGVVLRYGLFYGAAVPSTASMTEMVRRRRLPVVRSDTGQLPMIHIDDAVSATLLAIDGAAPGAVYDIVDDQAVSLATMVTTMAEYAGSPPPRRVPAWALRLLAPYTARFIATRLPLSNAKAKADLGWRPSYPTIREGLAPLARRAA